MKAVIITVGNEILKGRTVNTNTAYIGSFLTHMGYDVVRNLVVKDDPEEIGWAFETALSVSELVVSSGGLGPTFDDMTVSSFAKHFNIDLVLNQEVLSILREKYKLQGLPVTPERQKMAMLPGDAVAVRNDVGSAPGVFMRLNGKRVLILPGVPSEMKDILSNASFLIGGENSFYYDETIHLEGVMESSLAPFITELMKKYSGKVYIKSHPLGIENNNPRLDVEVYATGTDREKLEGDVRAVIEEIRENWKGRIGK